MVQEEGVSRMMHESAGGATSSTDVTNHNYDDSIRDQAMATPTPPLVMALVIPVVLGLIVLWCVIGLIYYNKQLTSSEVSPDSIAQADGGGGGGHGGGKKGCDCGEGSGGTTTIIVSTGAAWAQPPVVWYRW